MSPIAYILIILSVTSLVAGQVLLKHAMELTHLTPIPWKKFMLHFVPGVGSMTVWFLLWLSLLQTLDLSFVYPFEGLSAVLLSLAAAFILKEKLTLRLWIGVFLILMGVFVVSQS